MAYENTNPRYTNPYASQMNADPDLRAAAGPRSGGTVAGLLVAVLVVLGLIVGVSYFTAGDATDVQTTPAAPAAETIAPAEGMAPAGDSAAPATPDSGAAPTAPAE